MNYEDLVPTIVVWKNIDFDWVDEKYKVLKELTSSSYFNIYPIIELEGFERLIYNIKKYGQKQLDLEKETDNFILNIIQELDSLIESNTEFLSIEMFRVSGESIDLCFTGLTSAGMSVFSNKDLESILFFLKHDSKMMFLKNLDDIYSSYYGSYYGNVDHNEINSIEFAKLPFELFASSQYYKKTSSYEVIYNMHSKNISKINSNVSKDFIVEKSLSSYEEVIKETLNNLNDFLAVVYEFVLSIVEINKELERLTILHIEEFKNKHIKQLF